MGNKFHFSIWQIGNGYVIQDSDKEAVYREKPTDAITTLEAAVASLKRELLNPNPQK
jgi:hypothetical protein